VTSADEEPTLSDMGESVTAKNLTKTTVCS
jgi:hypothetical protein